MAKPIFKKIGKEYFKTVTTMMASAFGLVAALAWNDLVKSVIDKYISPGSGVVSQFIYTVIVTTFLVIITYQMGKLSEKIDKEGK